MDRVVKTAEYYLRLVMDHRNEVANHTFRLARETSDYTTIMEQALDRLDLADSIIKALQDFKVQHKVRRKIHTPSGHPRKDVTLELLRHLAEERLELAEEEAEEFEEWAEAYANAWRFVRKSLPNPNFESSILSFE
jgi:hypothetical protein